MGRDGLLMCTASAVASKSCSLSSLAALYEIAAGILMLKRSTSDHWDDRYPRARFGSARDGSHTGIPSRAGCRSAERGRDGINDCNWRHDAPTVGVIRFCIPFCLLLPAHLDAV